MAKSDDTEETKVTGVQDIQDALEGALDAEGEDQDELEEDQEDQQDDDDQQDDSEEGDDSDSDDDDSEDDDSSDDEDDDSDDDDSKDDDDDDSSERRFTQFKGDGSDKDYIKKLEDGYANSSTEAQRLNTELGTVKRQLDAINRVLSSNPQMAEALQKAMGGDGGEQGKSSKRTSDPNRDPFLRNSEREWREKSEQEAKEFVDANPEVLSDPKINAQVKSLIQKFSEIELEENDRLMTSGEAMAKAYAYLGLENKLKSKTEVASKAKKAAAPTRPQPSKKKSKPSSKDFTDLTMKFASKMGVSKETLSKHNK